MLSNILSRSNHERPIHTLASHASHLLSVLHVHRDCSCSPLLALTKKNRNPRRSNFVMNQWKTIIKCYLWWSQISSCVERHRLHKRNPAQAHFYDENKCHKHWPCGLIFVMNSIAMSHIDDMEDDVDDDDDMSANISNDVDGNWPMTWLLTWQQYGKWWWRGCWCGGWSQHHNSFVGRPIQSGPLSWA